MNVDELLQCAEIFDDLIGGISSARVRLDVERSQRQVTHIEHDHTRVDESAIFVAFSGTSVDSHQFIDRARGAHAACIIGENDTADIVVQNARAALGPLSAALNNFPSTQLLLAGITGTNGKTTVSYLYSSIVQAHKNHCFTMGTTGILLDGEKESDSQTTPDPLILQKTFIDFLERDVLHGVLEVSSHALDQYRVLGTEFGAVGFTNFSQDHLDYHTSMEEYFAAKMQFFMPTYSSRAVINIDDPYGEEVAIHATKNTLDVIRVSCKDSNADIFIDCIDHSVSGSTLNVAINGQSFECITDLFGEFNHENIAVALGLAYANGCDMATAVHALAHPDIVPGRLERTSTDGVEIFVDYAHTPDALERVIDVVKPLAKRVIVVFGCGGDRDRKKRPMMGRIVDTKADVAIITSDNPRSEDEMDIIRDIEAGMSGERTILPHRSEAIEHAINIAQPGDAIIIAGKGHERGQIFAEHVEDFSDIDVVRTLVERPQDDIQ